jgi:hypothetical protein
MWCGDRWPSAAIYPYLGHGQLSNSGRQDRRLAEDGGKRFTNNDSSQYVAWVGGLSRLLTLLDLTRGKGGKQPRFLRSRTALEALYSSPGSEHKTVADLVGDKQ